MNQPIIRLELEGMKETIVAGLVKYQDDLKAMVEEEVDRQIKAFDLQNYIRDQVHTSLQNLIKDSLMRHMSYELNKTIADEVEAAIAAKIKSKNLESPS